MEDSQKKSRFKNPFTSIGLFLVLAPFLALLFFPCRDSQCLEGLSLVGAGFILVPLGLIIIALGLWTPRRSSGTSIKNIITTVLIVAAIIPSTPLLYEYISRQILNNARIAQLQVERNESEYCLPIKKFPCPISLIFPKGEEKLIKGKTYQIKWKTTEEFKYPQVAITLVSYPENQSVDPDQPIPHITDNTGSYSWTIPKDFQPKIWVPSGSGQPVQFESNDSTWYVIMIEGWPPTGRGQGQTISSHPFYITR
jgi:hypothetical protein